ncbi:MAG: hypothetical protein ACU85U_20790 [Gammaproteobacteria bacterium]|jgi:hypothetical protein
MSCHDEVTPDFLARFAQAWNDHDLDTLMGPGLSRAVAMSIRSATAKLR